MIKILVFVFITVANILSGQGVLGQQIKQKPFLIKEQGSFAAGGKVLTHPGVFDPANPGNPNGQTFHGDHAYVFCQIPAKARKYPLVFAHGYGQFSKTWETTPDGREGFQNIFLRRHFGVYLVDQPRRGNAGRSTEPITITPAFDEQIWFNRFRVGTWPNYFEGVQFKPDAETLNQYYRQITPTTGPMDLNVYADAYAALLNKIGPAILETHSQGGPVDWKTLLKTNNTKAIVSYEPGCEFPFPAGENPSTVLTLAGNRESIDVSMADFMP
jgi:pimeloyl-ACP methyl ester carboxylesterase